MQQLAGEREAFVRAACLDILYFLLQRTNQPYGKDEIKRLQIFNTGDSCIQKGNLTEGLNRNLHLKECRLESYCYVCGTFGKYKLYGTGHI